MSSTLLDALKGKSIKAGTYTFLKSLMDDILKRGKSTTLFTGKEYIITSPVEQWVFLEDGGIVIITKNSAYHAILV